MKNNYIQKELEKIIDSCCTPCECHGSIDEDKLTEAITKLFREIVERIISQDDITIENTYPVFRSSQEYAEHIRVARERLQSEMRSVAANMLGEQ